eukprot:CAMPEP_0202975578 /NCGR_PEP_ID=MMETSP1396-20130829/70185_1 /ASSEMBLY_ACC=CAM_ASM_000872 /TAXON_ID= /ORGANISM="Pseudokeronopsis sp., Strain Brazil" /LENGTH=43 /DNA_ID= /DNA_START= /DNA_END= /DNA_ORIENTATION=
MKPLDYLYKEKALVLAKAKNYAEAFNVSIDKMQDIEYALAVAK